MAEKVVTRTAEYYCIERLRQREVYDTVSREVSVPAVAGEKPEDTTARLERAARELGRVINGCQNAEFKGFNPAEDRKKKAEETPKKLATVGAEVWSLSECIKRQGYMRCVPKE